ncbi:MAG: hypothetical protein IJC94_07920 [Oscillospiraceae bacterium]|nr:hypothetical protein [Oscillospiraceae bacterium]MBQ9938233.1 hypothetical protein [Oscillospiraceae bacterium]
MLPEMRYVENELLPMLRERAPKIKENVQKQLRQWNGEKGVCNLLLRVGSVPEAAMLPDYDMYEIHYDPEKMFISELKSALSAAMANGDSVPSVRANVGCGALCTLYGGLSQTFYPDKMPWLLKHLTEEQLTELTVESLEESPEFKAGLEQMRFMKEMLEGTGIEVYPMDLQGPIDMAHLLMGDEFFYAVYDDPELVHKVLEMALAADIYGMEKCLEIIAPTDHVCHYNSLVLPAEKPLKVSEDTSTLLCEEHLNEYMKPYTERLLAHFGGGYIHYCGDNKHLLKLVPTVANNLGLNFGNPERHDPKTVLDDLAEVGLCYYGSFPSLSAVELARLARREDGRYNCFVQAGCPIDEQQRFIEEFNNALL